MHKKYKKDFLEFAQPLPCLNLKMAQEQATLSFPLKFEGVGVHSGLSSCLHILPAPVNTGYVFKRLDVPIKESLIPARYDTVVDTMMCTKIANSYGVSVSTVEHVLAALNGHGITNAILEVSGPEVPIMDGSSSVFSNALSKIRKIIQKSNQSTIKIISPVRVETQHGYAEFIPSASRKIEISFDFSGRLKDSPLGGDLTYDLDEDNFNVMVSHARTFGLYEDALKLKSAGLAKGASFENTVVLKDDEVMNQGGLRFANELVCHKMLDIIGDIALANCAIVGTLKSHNPGHSLTNQLLRKLFSTPSAWIHKIF